MRKLIFWLILPLLYLSCTNTVPEPIIVSSLTSNYILAASQRLTPSGPVYQLVVQTLGPSDCINDAIDAELQNDGTIITLNIEGIIDGEPCQLGESYPTIDLDLEETIGEIPFEINIQSFPSITGTISFEDSAFFINELSSEGVGINRDYIFKVPRGMGWGYIDENSVASLDITPLRQFFPPSISFDLVGDQYGFFSINEDQGLEISYAPDDSDIFVFDAKSDDFWNDLATQLDEYKTKYPDIHYEFNRWNGETLFN